MNRCIDYVLPLRWDDDDDLADLTRYLADLSRWARVTVVDGSRHELYDSHRRTWEGMVTVVRPDALGCLNGKVDAVHTGLCLARSEWVVIADDDVRYDLPSLRAATELLAGADLVAPQNVFRPLPWHAAWDTARSLINRSFGADYPGTFAVRRSAFWQVGGYDGDVLFENLELMRTFWANGLVVARPRGLYVTRRPPTARKFWSQRVRQAYDDMAQPGRLVVSLAVLPVLGWWAVASRRRSQILGGLAVPVLMAEVGRRRAGGRVHFPWWTTLLAPAWTLERAVCSWVALASRARGGVRYSGSRLAVAAHPTRRLRKPSSSGHQPVRRTPEPRTQMPDVIHRRTA